MSGREFKISQNQTSISQFEDGAKNKKTGQYSFEETLKIYRKMFWFNWDLKEIANSRHSPSKYTFTV